MRYTYIIKSEGKTMKDSSVLAKGIDRDQFVNQMMELSVKSRNAYLREHAIRMLERHADVEDIDLSDADYVRKCK